MNLDIEHYVHKAKWIDDELCDEAIDRLNLQQTWLPFPKDVVNAYPDELRPQDGIKGSTPVSYTHLTLPTNREV